MKLGFLFPDIPLYPPILDVLYQLKMEGIDIYAFDPSQFHSDNSLQLTSQFLKSTEPIFQIKRFNPDLVLSGISILPYLWFAIKVIKKPFVNFVLTFPSVEKNISPISIKDSIYSYYISKLNKLALSPLSKSSDLKKIILPSIIRRKYFQENSFPQDKIEVLPWGLSISKYSYDSSNYRDNKQILYAGPLSSNRGVVTLLRAFEKVVEFIDADLVMAFREFSYDLDREIVEKYQKKLGNRLRIIWRPLEYKDLIKLIKESTVVVLPLEIQNRTLEPPLTVIESMALGKPVISTKCDALYGVMDEHTVDLLVPNRDSDTMARKIVELLVEPSKAKSYGILCRKIVEERYDLRKFTLRLKSILSDYR